ncbi:MAG: hypothetical protein R3E79_44015 [Caldilineaceae bacterium]
MFAYHLPGGLPAGSRTVWSQLPLQPLAARPLTPFSYSVLDEVAKSAWYQYFDELGFAPMPRARVLRQYKGRAYLNVTLSAQRDAEHAAVEPLTLLVNDEPFRVASWEKPGFFATLKHSRNRKKIQQLLETYCQQVAAVTQNAESWYAKTQELRWTQADILQVMEEVERVSVASFKLFFAARHNLEQIYNRLLWSTQAQHPFPANVSLIHRAICDLPELVECQMAKRVVALGEVAGADSATWTWLKAGQLDHWPETLPNQSLRTAIDAFLQQYGHRTVVEAEISGQRWQQDPSLLFASLLAYGQKQRTLPTEIQVGRATPPVQQTQSLLQAVTTDQRKHVEQQLQQVRQLLLLQSQALHAFAYILAGTRRWALAAATEALADQRIEQAEDVFFFQLEEVKQMMTGEWNVSSRQEICKTCNQRKAEFAQWQQSSSPTLLIGETPALAAHQGIPGSSGQAVGQLQRWQAPCPKQEADAVIGTQQLDSGWALVLPFVGAFVTASGTPIDPMTAAAHIWHTPTVLALGERYSSLVEGMQTTVDGDRGAVIQKTGVERLRSQPPSS